MNFNQTLAKDAAATVLATLEAKAFLAKLHLKLDVRTSYRDGVLWYDLLDGRAVRIDQEGWDIEDHPPIIFERHSIMAKQIEPVAGGELELIEPFVNLNTPAEHLLFKVYLIAAFIPGFPHPLLVMHGPQGAGKTTPLRLLKKIIDPSSLGQLPPPRTHADLIQVAAHSSFLFFDNLSDMPEWFSDALARLSTGEGFAKRQLYTDDSDIIYNLMLPVGLTGISMVVEKQDLLDRAILLELKRISKTERVSEESLKNQIDSKLPQILGAVFTTLSNAMKIRPFVYLGELPRMADFALWGEATSRALGNDDFAFTKAYNSNINHQIDVAIESSVTAQSIMIFTDETPFWEGSPTELYERLDAIVRDHNLDRSEWPHGANWLSKRIVQAQANLLERGIQIEKRRDGFSRYITIRKVNENADDSVIPSGLSAIFDGPVQLQLDDFDKQSDSTVDSDGKNPRKDK